MAVNELIFFGLAATACVIFCVYCLYRTKRGQERIERRSRNNNRQPLLSDAAQSIYVDPLSDGWMCVICGHDNPIISGGCALCGTSKEFAVSYASMKKLKQKQERKRKKYVRKKLKEKQMQREREEARVQRASRGTNVDIESGQRNGMDSGESGIESDGSQTERDDSIGKSVYSDDEVKKVQHDLDLSTHSDVSISALSNMERFEAFNFRRLNALSQRQKGARRRKMWQREMDEETGTLVWKRQSIKLDVIAKQSRFGKMFTRTPLKKKKEEKEYGGQNSRPTKYSIWSLFSSNNDRPHHSESNADSDTNVGDLSTTVGGSIENSMYSASGPRMSSDTSFQGSGVSSVLRGVMGHGPMLTPGQSFDAGSGASSPGFTTTILADGTVAWTQVVTGVVATTGADEPFRRDQLKGVVEALNEGQPLRSDGSSNGIDQYVPETEAMARRLLSAQVDERDLRSAIILPFRDKQYWFLCRMVKLQRPWADGYIKLVVDREQALVSSFTQISALLGSSMHRYMRVVFVGEPGIDAGGVQREWFQLVASQLLDPELGLFVRSSGADSNGGSYHINPLSGVEGACKVHADHLKWFLFAGRLFGKAIMEQQALDAPLSLPLRKQILNIPITFSDLELIDQELFRNLHWLRKNSHVETLSLDFNVRYQHNGFFLDRELVSNGGDVLVTDANKSEYLSLVLRDRMLDSVKPQLEQFLCGLYQVIPSDLLSVFDYQELDLLLCGIQQLDATQWLENTEYLGEYQRLGRRHKVIKWFWAAVGDMSEEEKVRLLQFVTGSSRLPAQGFAALQSNDGNFRKFNIQSIPTNLSQYPRAHTCFNKLDLPLYKSQAELEAYLSIVVNMEVTGFTID
jgi:hypothetical protein